MHSFIHSFIQNTVIHGDDTVAQATNKSKAPNKSFNQLYSSHKFDNLSVTVRPTQNDHITVYISSL